MFHDIGSEPSTYQPLGQLRFEVTVPTRARDFSSGQATVIPSRNPSESYGTHRRARVESSKTAPLHPQSYPEGPEVVAVADRSCVDGRAREDRLPERFHRPPRTPSAMQWFSRRTSRAAIFRQIMPCSLFTCIDEASCRAQVFGAASTGQQ